MAIRQPIVTVAGHVDHGKTTLLDTIRGTCIARKEAGLITQKISFTNLTKESIQEKCDKILTQFKIPLEIPGFVFIDTPGHAAFSNLRKRGGALANLAILVVDINEGLKEQTRESIEVLKSNKVPFIVALNKVDSVPGWKRIVPTVMANIDKQAQFTKTEFEKKLYALISSLSMYGFDSDLFFRISKFEKQLALVPCSAKTGEGIPELISMLVGLSQRFLKDELKLGEETRGTILEVQKEKGLTTVEAIIYDGTLKKTDTIVLASFDKPVVLKMRALFEALPLCQGFKARNSVTAASGVQLHFPNEFVDRILPGMPFITVKDTKPETIKKAEAEIQQNIQGLVETNEEGVIVKADSLGSLEALMFLLKKSKINAKKAGIGNINRMDLALAKSNIEKEPLNAVILGFNVKPDKELENLQDEKIKIITSEVVYKIIEDLEKWRKERELELQREALKDLTWPAKIKLLNNSCFHDAKPAIFGVNIVAGILKKGNKLMDSEGEDVDHVKEIQYGSKGMDKAEAGKDVAISLPGTIYSRQLKPEMILYSNLNEQEFLKLKENKKYLSQQEISLLQEIATIKRKTKATWGV